MPGTEFRSARRCGDPRAAAADRAPLRGAVRVLVVLVDFSDKPMTATAAALRGSVLLDRQDAARAASASTTHEVTQRPGRPSTARWSGRTGCRRRSPRTPAATPAPASPAAERADHGARRGHGCRRRRRLHAVRQRRQRLRRRVHRRARRRAAPRRPATPNDIWSHKWVFNGGAFNADGTKIFGYLTIPEDCKIGVCAHELGHLLFGWPDLYDTDESSRASATGA